MLDLMTWQKWALAEEPVEQELRVPDAIWPSDNEFDIPTLSMARMARSVVLPVDTWGRGRGARSRRMRGTWHFYTEDYRFDALWKDPAPVLRSGCQQIVEPNFSCYTDMPRTVALWAIYRKRWLARFWQSYGVDVFVDLNVAEPHYADNLLGVPRGWLAWATRGYVERLDHVELEHAMACEHAGTSEITFLVYGGGKAVRELCKRRGWVHIYEQRDVAKGIGVL